MSMNELHFESLDLIRVPVTIGDKHYVLQEASGEATAKYRNALLESTKLGPDGKAVSVKGLADVEMLLISLCLEDGQGKQVPVSVLKTWPNRILKTLFDKAKEISELTEEKVKENPTSDGESKDSEAGSN